MTTIQVLNGLPRNGDYVFQWRGERIDDCNTLAFQNAVKAAKVAPLRWHDLRHKVQLKARTKNGTLKSVTGKTLTSH